MISMATLMATTVRETVARAPTRRIPAAANQKNFARPLTALCGEVHRERNDHDQRGAEGDRVLSGCMYAQAPSPHVVDLPLVAGEREPAIEVVEEVVVRAAFVDGGKRHHGTANDNAAEDLVDVAHAVERRGNENEHDDEAEEERQ